jgi:hypothetical protein
MLENSIQRIKTVIRKLEKRYRFLSLSDNIITMITCKSGAHPASYPVGTKGFLPGGKAAGV